MDSSTNVDFVNKASSASSGSATSMTLNHSWSGGDITRYNNKGDVVLTMMSTREMVEHIHSFLSLEEVLSSRRVCASWKEWFWMKILPSSHTLDSDVNLFPLFLREMFEAAIGRFGDWLSFFVGEFRNERFKFALKLKSASMFNARMRRRSNRSNGRRKYVMPPCSYPLFSKLAGIFILDRHRSDNVSLHNILFSWLRGLKALSLHWLSLYDVSQMEADLDAFYKSLSSDYIEPEKGSIPLLKNERLSKLDYLSSYLGLLTLNGDFSLFRVLAEKISNHPSSACSLSALFPRQHFPNHVYRHRHTFGVGYNVYGLCQLDLVHIALRLCDIPRSVCSLKVIRFALCPHILVEIQSDLVSNGYRVDSGNVLEVSLNRRIVLIKKLCFYFDLVATIHSSNLNRGHLNEYLVYSQLKKYCLDDEHPEEEEEVELLNNLCLWKRYMVLCHFRYFERKFGAKSIGALFAKKSPSVDAKWWRKLEELMDAVIAIYPEAVPILKAPQNTEAVDVEMEQYLKRQFSQYLSSVALLDCIGSVFAVDENRSRLKSMERRGPLTMDEFESFRHSVLASHDVRQYFLAKYDLEALYDAINNVSFHDHQLNVNDDPNDKDIGIQMKHGDIQHIL